MATDDPGRQPFILSGTAATSGGGTESGLADLGPVPAGKRLVVESVSAQLIIPTSASPYTLQLNGAFTLFLVPVPVSMGAFGLNRYFANSTARFYVEAGDIIQLQVATVGGDGEAQVYISGYLLDV